ncbi:cation-translocating P-type ATPase [Peterkaempfera bronchialis]|uniref:cation-translocating P-type ATPase n=1 Tax=Peterkaempfera bronchialis TaxID=2126346 RepID=UPI0022468B1B|nr:cation-translocating P-type ATPase [Peterkaempfera bronchialis]
MAPRIQVLPPLPALIAWPVSLATAAGEAAGAALASAARWGQHAVHEALVGLPADIAEAAAVLVDVGKHRTRRRVWSRPGRAHIEVRGLTGHGDRHQRLVRGLTTVLRETEGVRWAAVNAVLGQVVVDVEEDGVDLDQLLELVERVELEHGTSTEPFAGTRPYPPFESAPATLAKTSLAADCLGLAVAAVRQVTPLPALPPMLRVPVVVADAQPRVRRLLEARLGRAHADMLLGVSNAAVHSLTMGVAPLALDAVQRLLQLSEIRSRQAVWQLREAELVRTGDKLPREAPDPSARPVPLPAGPVETCGDRTSLAALLGAGGLLAWTHSPEQAAEAILATVPKAAGMGREAFASRLAGDLARDGVVPMDGGALRLLDRISTVLIDSAALCTARLRLLSVTATGDLDEAGLWSAAQSVLTGRPLPELCGEGPWTHGRWRLERPADAPQRRPDDPSALPLDLYDTDGRHQARILVGCELDPLADALLGAARSGTRRLLLTEHASAAELLPWADHALPLGPEPLHEQVRRLQGEGQGVLLISAGQDHALAAADLGVAVLPRPGAATGAVCWSADLICGPGLAQPWRILTALDEADRVSSRSAHLSMGGSALGALLAAAGTRRRVAGLTTSPVYGAAFLAVLGGMSAARRVARQPLPPVRVRGDWHALGPLETLDTLQALHDSQSGGQSGGEPGAQPSRRSAEQPSAPRHPLYGTLQEALRTLVGLPLLGTTALGAASLLAAVREELRDPLTPVLALGAAASAAVGSSVDSALVGGVMVGNAVVSGAQRLRAERALSGLILGERVTARRVDWAPPARTAADRTLLPAGLEAAPARLATAEDLRVGDIIALRPSDVVPADARLLVSDRLELDEAVLTGESGPVAKDPRATPGADLAERSCMVYQGCTVLAGTGYAVVVADRAQSEAGRAADLAGRATVPIGVEGHLAALTKAALPAVGVGGAVVTLLGLLRGVPVREALASGVAIAVAAVPEGLPLVATVAQSAAARRLSQRGVLTRSARVLEALGRVDVVCFDKTGTLTEGRPAVTRVTGLDHDLLLDSPAGHHLLRIAARACPQARPGQVLAHATDQAVVDAAVAQCGQDQAWQPVTELPFEASRGYAASLGIESGQPCLAVKGAPETVLARCTTSLGARLGYGGDPVPLDATGRRSAHDLVQRLASDGLRVLAVAEARPAPAAAPADGEPLLVSDLTLLGFLAIADTTRPGAAETVKRLSDAGVRVAMITGDHPTTASAVARELGIPQAETVLTGSDMDTLPDGERSERIARTTVFARVSPEHKVRIVRALQQAGHVVAMTGDGVNDAAAIRLADVGIGLSAHGSTSARAASDLVLTEPDPTRILDALLEGRTLWRSVRDAVAILVGGNAGEVAFTVLGTALAGRAPLGTRQLLLVNLLTDMLPALAVALAPARRRRADEDPLADGPSPSLLGRDLARILTVRGTATTLGAASAWQIGRVTGLSRRAGTMGLAALVATQLGQTLITDWHSPLVLATSSLSAAALIGIVETPGLSHFFGCTPLGPLAWTTVGVCSTTATLAAAVAPRLLSRSGPGTAPA